MSGESAGRSPEVLVQKLIELVFNKHDLDAVDGIIASEYVQHNPDVSGGRNGFKEYLSIVFSTFPDFRYELKEIVANGQSVAVRATIHFSVSSRGPEGARLTQQVGMDAAGFFRVEDGFIREHWEVVDRLKAWIAIGLVSPSAEYKRDANP